jgi:hypothetical protein
MQLTAFGPGVVTNTTQNRANRVHASKLIQYTGGAITQMATAGSS